MNKKINKNNKITISVIVPVYNVENYLEKCVETIVNQTYKNIEILLIDDGSKDSSSEKCDYLEKKYKNVKTYHKTNGGLSSARNYGIDRANGEYIVFVDSDDYIEKNMIEHLYNNIKETNAEMSICSFYYVKNSKKDAPKYAKECFIVNNENKFDYLYNDYYLPTTIAWNKIYSRKIFEKLRYPEGKYHEDEFMIFDILKNVSKISYTLVPLYNYVFRDDSITKKFSLKRLDCLEALDEREKYFKSMNRKDLIILNKQSKLNVIATFLTEYYSSNNNCDIELIKNYRLELRKIAKELILKKYIPIYKKIKILMIFIVPDLYFFVNKYRF